jgi:signal transduction histidine kinase/ActR/RegA family two-component response regulator
MALALTEDRAVRGAEAIVLRPDGSRRWFTPYPTPLHDDEGRVVGGINMLVDITERKEVEEALKDADRRKDEFLAMLAHELRNPLAPITNAVHLMRRARIEDPLLQQASAMIDRQASRLARLVDDLLEVSRITTGRIQLHLERIDLGGVIERALESTRAIIEQHGHALTVAKPSTPVWLYADAARLEQVLVNLLNNAAKYTNDGGRIEVEAHVEGRHATVSVRDTGVGIEPELLPRIFDLFTQAERTLDRSQGGLGIGLCLVQRLVTMHGGAVEARSVLGQGSEFLVRLPTLQSEQVAHSSMSVDSSSRQTRGSLRVLIVDDNVDAAQSLGMLLEASGHEIHLAHGGLDAIEAVRAHRPQVVLLDIGLPQIDGYEAAKRLRALYPREAITVVAMTGYGQAADRERSRAAGFDHHLVKPADYAEVERILAQAQGADPLGT